MKKFMIGCFALLSLWTSSIFAETIKVVYHINQAPAHAAVVLGNIQYHLNADPTTKVVVVTHGPGIEFLMRDATNDKGVKFSSIVGNLKNQGVDFYVCNNTLEYRKLSQDRLIDGVKFVPSGVSEIARLQAQEGYVYLKP